jgi:hypothetical protein
MSQKMVFDRKGTFTAYNDAETWCFERGFSVGMMSRNDPIGLWLGNVTVAKWINLTREERSMLDGKMTGDMRNGPITVEIY